MMNDEPRDPRLADLIENAVQAGTYGLRVMLPGRVDEYDPKTNRCSVTPLVMDGDEDEAGEPVAVALPTLHDVPVAFFAIGDVSITARPKKGDEVMLVFASSSISQLKSRRRVDRAVDPRDDRRHDLNDAYAIPVRAITVIPNAATETDALVIQGPDIRLGGPNATERVAREVDLQFLKDAIDASPDGSGFGSALKAELADWPNCTSKVRSE